MNALNSCGTPTCNDYHIDSSSQCCKRSKYVEKRKWKWEPRNQHHSICNTKNCQIFGGHDLEPMTDYTCRSKAIKSKSKNNQTLGSPIGMVASSINLNAEAQTTDIIQARYATYLKAFARLHITPETMWTTALLDELIREGVTLSSNSDKEEDEIDLPNDIYTQSEKRIQRNFEMSEYKFQVELMKNFQMTTSFEAGAHGDDGQILLNDLKPALRRFLRHHKHCMLTLGSIYVMIWRLNGIYFVLDVCGRRIGDFNTDHGKGFAMLICLKSLWNVEHLLRDLTKLDNMDSCTLREIKLVKLEMPSGLLIRRDYGTRVHEYEIINDDYAHLKASLHLTLNKRNLLRNRSALPAAVIAIVLSKIDHPATWNMKIIDKILCFGVSFCQNNWTKCFADEAIDVTEFPRIFQLGQFSISMEIVARKYEDIWHCVPGYRYSRLAHIIEMAFAEGDQQLLLQINAQIYAVWKNHDFIYLLDPYRHRILDRAGESQIFKEMPKSATVRLFRSFDVFMNNFNHILLDSNRTSPFYIHTIKIANIQLAEKREQKVKLAADGEIESLNEYICFQESDDICHNLLEEISDYEDEDLFSDVDELELKTSSSEDEDALEEEEAMVGGEEEELQGIETSSSEEEIITKSKLSVNKRKKSKPKKSPKSKKSNNNKAAKEKTKDDEDLSDFEDEEFKMDKAIEEKKSKGKNKKDKKSTEDQELKSKASEKKDREDQELKLKAIEKDKIEVDKNKEKENVVQENPIKKSMNSNEKPKVQTEKDKVLTREEVLATKSPTEENKNLESDKNKSLPKDKDSTIPKLCKQNGNEADDENEDFLKNLQRFCTDTNINPTNRYPGYYKCPLNMAVVASENGSYQSLCKLLQAGFLRADRLLVMTPFGNFVVIRVMGAERQDRQYYLFDGCICNVNRFRYLDLSLGTAGFLCFQNMHDLIEYMRNIKIIQAKKKRPAELTADEICQQYCG